MGSRLRFPLIGLMLYPSLPDSGTRPILRSIDYLPVACPPLETADGLPSTLVRMKDNVLARHSCGVVRIRARR